MKMSLKCEILCDDVMIDMDMEKFSDLSTIEGFYWASNDEPLSDDKPLGLPPIKLILPSNNSLKDQASNSHGHLSCREYLGSIDHEENSSEMYENQVVVNQNEALQIDQCEYYEEIEIEDDSSQINGEELLECRWEDCWKLFQNQKDLVFHIESAHIEPQRGSEVYPCLWEACPRGPRPFNARYKLLIHMRVHSGEKPNKCIYPGCYKAFSRLENLKIHQRSHTGERPYLCQFASCKKAFSNSSDRAKHQRTHLDTRPYACQIKGCRKRYTDPSSLRKHVRHHRGMAQISPKKLVASEPIVSLTEIQSRSSRHNSVSSDTYSSQEQDLSPSWCSSQDATFFDYDDSLTDQLDSDVEREFLDSTELESSSFLSLNEEDIIRTFS